MTIRLLPQRTFKTWAVLVDRLDRVAQSAGVSRVAVMALAIDLLEVHWSNDQARTLVRLKERNMSKGRKHKSPFTSGEQK